MGADLAEEWEEDEDWEVLLDRLDEGTIDWLDKERLQTEGLKMLQNYKMTWKGGPSQREGTEKVQQKAKSPTFKLFFFLKPSQGFVTLILFREDIKRTSKLWKLHITPLALTLLNL